MVNGQEVAYVNGELFALVNGQLRAMVNGDGVAAESVRQFANGQLRQLSMEEIFLLPTDSYGQW